MADKQLNEHQIELVHRIMSVRGFLQLGLKRLNNAQVINLICGSKLGSIEFKIDVYMTARCRYIDQIIL